MAAHRSALLAAALALVAGMAHAQVYQWKDARGVTHYGDAPPPKGQEFKTRNISTPAPAASPTPAPSSSAAAGNATAGDKPAAATAGAARAQANCQAATTNLAHLQAKGDIGFDANGDGKPDKVMGADERVEQTRIARQNIAAYCKGGAASP